MADEKRRLDGIVPMTVAMAVLVLLGRSCIDRMTSDGSTVPDAANPFCVVGDECIWDVGGESSVPEQEDFAHFVPPTTVAVPAMGEVASADECPPTRLDQRPDSTDRPRIWDGLPPVCVDLDAELIATVTTNFGAVEIELDPSLAPNGVAAFAFLANWGWYDGVTISGPSDISATATNDWLRFDSPYGETEPNHPRAGFLLSPEPFPEEYAKQATAPIYVVLPATEADGYVDPSAPHIVFSLAGREDLETRRGADTVIGHLVELSEDERSASCPTRGQGYECTGRALTSGSGMNRTGRTTSLIPIVVHSVIVETMTDRDRRTEEYSMRRQLEDLEQEIKDLEAEIDDMLNPPWPVEPEAPDTSDYDRLDELHEERDEIAGELNNYPESSPGGG